MRIFICFDGSPHSEQAVEQAGALFAGAEALVAHAWQPPLPIASMKGGAAFQVAHEVEADLAAQANAHALETAEAGARRATVAGLRARPLEVRAAGAVWSALLDAADEHDADVLVAGSRGWGEVRSLLLGSTSSGLVHHARRPILVVPGRDGTE